MMMQGTPGYGVANTVGFRANQAKDIQDNG